MDKGRLLTRVAHEELTHAEGWSIEKAYADQKGIGAGAAGHPRSLGIDKGGCVEVDFVQLIVLRNGGHHVLTVSVDSRQGRVAVGGVGRPRFLGHKAGTQRRVQKFAMDHGFNARGCRLWLLRFRCRLWLIGHAARDT